MSQDSAPNVAPQMPSELESRIIQALKTVYDPEIPVDIYELGLIYQLDVDEASGKVKVQMTLTAPGCPVAGSMPEWVQSAVEAVEGVEECEVELVWEPMWTPQMMSMRAKIELNML
ncbi:MAG TPA: SUF system Fe-S cluster assembly protein [Candidatus Competibacteraceae bacterium]|nr:SUF system Fe-S cluster assembly protein [Candidatus Competibacteraceae bacterium]